MKDYEQPIATIIRLSTQDVITSSNDDNIGGAQDGWGGNIRR